MRFLHYRQGDVLEKNRFGILEPLRHQTNRSPRGLDAVLMPLVGFDRAGHRLGMGGGFYDRAFAFRFARSHGRPLLIGLAHSIQEVDSLDACHWDVPMDAIVTDRAVFWLRKQRD